MSFILYAQCQSVSGFTLVSGATVLIHYLEERLVRFEMIFFRLLHVLAHHPDFGMAEEALRDIAR